MTREEFMQKLEIVEQVALDNHIFTCLQYDENDNIVEISSEEYRTIEMVYTYHPAIDCVGGKIQIATLYAYGGMGVIRNMVPTAIKAREIEEQIREVQAKKCNLLAQLDELKTGRSKEVIME